MNHSELFVDGSSIVFSNCVLDIFYHNHIQLYLENDAQMRLDDCLIYCGYIYDKATVTVEFFNGTKKEVYEYTNGCVHYWIQTVNEVA